MEAIQEFVSNLSDKEKKALYITVLIVLLALLDGLLFRPSLERLKNIDDEISKQESSVAQDLRFLVYKDKILQESQVFSKFYTDNVQDDDVVNAAFLSMIEKIATKENITLVKSNPSPSKKQKRYIEYYADLDCTGQLKDMISFMHAINSSDELLKVVKFNVAPKKGAANEVTTSMTVVKLVISPRLTIDTTDSDKSSQGNPKVAQASK